MENESGGSSDKHIGIAVGVSIALIVIIIPIIAMFLYKCVATLFYEVII